MRSQKDISKFCDRLKAAWSCVPELRFGQFIEEVGDYINTEVDPYYIEDNVLIAYIEQCAKAFCEMKE